VRDLQPVVKLQHNKDKSRREKQEGERYSTRIREGRGRLHTKHRQLFIQTCPFKTLKTLKTLKTVWPKPLKAEIAKQIEEAFSRQPRAIARMQRLDQPINGLLRQKNEIAFLIPTLQRRTAF
jgi:hypothetical protein